ncbi:hypothetical protein [Sphingopyxis sp. LC363]|uniref:hypothetical protein n=1 Tax=Sphingopyxis sp. LC363 TaxID=1120705 RepID=UPI00050F486B|nr:hypothetical protein [Sphingopyxis sp. LC363]KGB52292.1 hypothetical protein FG95_03556 [Sphingopyxis sp. LC363]
MPLNNHMHCGKDTQTGRGLFLRDLLAATALVATAAFASPATAAESNRYMGELTIRSLPDELPEFLRSDAAALNVGELTREPDRWRNAGPVFDAQRHSAHYTKLDDNGVAATGLKLSAFPPTQEEYAIILHKKGLTERDEGTLYYTMITQFEQLKQDFAYYRVQTAALKNWTDEKQLAWLRQDMNRRQAQITEHLALLVHWAGDAMSPLHTSIHINEWAGTDRGKYPVKVDHFVVEGQYVLKYLTRESVLHEVAPLHVCEDNIQVCLAKAFEYNVTFAEPLYKLVNDGGFPANAPDPRGVRFMTEATARQVSLARDLVVKAWRESADQTLGYPPGEVKVRDIVNGAVPTFEQLHGWD